MPTARWWTGCCVKPGCQTDDALRMTTRAMILGYGNPLRGDDAGVAAAERLRALVRKLKFSLPQLTPELAAALAECDAAIFLDAQPWDAGHGLGHATHSQPSAPALRITSLRRRCWSWRRASTATRRGVSHHRRRRVLRATAPLRSSFEPEHVGDFHQPIRGVLLSNSLRRPGALRKSVAWFRNCLPTSLPFGEAAADCVIFCMTLDRHLSPCRCGGYCTAARLAASCYWWPVQPEPRPRRASAWIPEVLRLKAYLAPTSQSSTSEDHSTHFRAAKVDLRGDGSREVLVFWTATPGAPAAVRARHPWSRTTQLQGFGLGLQRSNAHPGAAHLRAWMA